MLSIRRFYADICQPAETHSLRRSKTNPVNSELDPDPPQAVNDDSTTMLTDSPTYPGPSYYHVKSPCCAIVPSIPEPYQCVHVLALFR